MEIKKTLVKSFIKHLSHATNSMSHSVKTQNVNEQYLKISIQAGHNCKEKKSTENPEKNFFFFRLQSTTLRVNSSFMLL